MEDVIKLLIREHGVCERILLIDSFHYSSIAINTEISKRVLQYFGQPSVNNKDMLLVLINIGLIRCFHWVLAVIAFSQK